jgi:hypothetical protein
MKNSVQIAHDEQLFPRDLSPKGWVYRDRNEHFFALKARVLGFDLLGFDDFLERELTGPNCADVLAWLMKRRGQARDAIDKGNLPLGRAIVEMLHVYYQLVRREDVLLPKARHGSKFVGKKRGASGPVRKAIAKVLKLNPALKTEDVWQTLTDKPPKGMDFHGDGKDRHIWTDQRGPTGWHQFQNLVSEERTKLKR